MRDAGESMFMFPLSRKQRKQPSWFPLIYCNFLIQGTLATIYRQRGRLRDCEAVLDLELEVLIRYQRSSLGACAQQVCLSSLFYTKA